MEGGGDEKGEVRRRRMEDGGDETHSMERRW
jgi:hypothetical protein